MSLKQLRFGTKAFGLLALAALISNVLPLAFSADHAAFLFDEGSGPRFFDATKTAEGRLGLPHDPESDQPVVNEAGPSGSSDDFAIRTRSAGYLMAEDTSDALRVEAGSMTVEAWVKPPSISQRPNGTVLSYGVGGYTLQIVDGQLAWGTGAYQKATNFNRRIPAGQWSHVAAAWTPGVGVTFYLNGLPNHALYTNTIPYFRDRILRVGYGQLAVDRVRIHRRVLAAEELDFVAADPKPGLIDTVANYQFDGAALPAASHPSDAPLLQSSVNALPVLTGPTWSADSPSGLSGDFSLRYDGSSHAYVPDSSKLIPVSGHDGNFTIQTWIKLPHTAPADSTYIFHHLGLSYLQFSFDENLVIYGSRGARVPNDDQWHHVAIVNEAQARARFYIDGSLIETSDALRSWGVNPSRTNFAIGAYFTGGHGLLGSIDRLRYSSYALTTNGLDFHADPRVPRVYREPEDTSTDIGEPLLLHVEVQTNHPTSFQWSRLRDGVTAWEPVPGATGTDLHVASMLPHHNGFYALTASNEFGIVTTRAAKVMAREEPAFLRPKWSLLPGQQTYLHTHDELRSLDQQRGVAHVKSGNQLVFGEANDVLHSRMTVADGATGARTTQLKTNAVVGSYALPIGKVAATEDGTIYAVNYGLPTGTGPFHLYRWQDATASGERLYSSDRPPGNVRQHGEHMVARGTGLELQILIAGSDPSLILFTRHAVGGFIPTVIQTDASPGGFMGGVAFGRGSSFYAKGTDGPLVKYEFNLTSKSARVVRTYRSVSEKLVNFAVHPNGPLIAGIHMRTGSDELEIYALNELEANARLLASAPFPLNMPNVRHSGGVAFGKASLFALNTYNGLMAFDLPSRIEEPTMRIGQQSSGLFLNWWAGTDGYVVETTQDLRTGIWSEHSPAGSFSSPEMMTPDGSARFFRLRKVTQ